MSVSVVERVGETVAGGRFADVHWFEEMGSTNTWLADRVRAGRVGTAAAPDGMVCVTDHQSAGRGRLARTWVAPPGSALLFSVLIRPRGPVAHWQLLSVAMGIAVVETVRALGAAEIGLKWPNDVVLPDDGRKLAGILAEALPDHGAVIVGTGCNLARPSVVAPEVAERGVWLDELGVRVDAGELLGPLLVNFAARLDELDTDPGALLDRYRGLCSTIGRDVRVMLPGSDLLGRAVGVDGEGQLLIDPNPGDGGGPLVTVSAGDVVHVRTT